MSTSLIAFNHLRSFSGEPFLLSITHLIVAKQAQSFLRCLSSIILKSIIPKGINSIRKSFYSLLSPFTCPFKFKSDLSVGVPTADTTLVSPSLLGHFSFHFAGSHNTWNQSALNTEPSDLVGPNNCSFRTTTYIFCSVI